MDSLFLGASDATRGVRQRLERAAKVDSAVLITGESGVGKELVAREIHARSSRAGQPFVPLNCAAIPDTLIESELFGHEPGAYTDARTLRRGAFEMAHEGTLFLDEVGDLSLTAQPKLLRSLEESKIQRIGGERERSVDLRVVAATNQNLKRMCKEKLFRTELYYRLNVLSIHVPPLRERPEDVPVLAEHFAAAVGRRFGRSPVAISPRAMEQLRHHTWPGNVRELRSIVERALAMSSSNVLDTHCFELDPLSVPGISGVGLLEKDWRAAREGFEAAYVRRMLRKHGGDVQKAARAAGLATGSFYKILRRLGIRPGPRSS